MAAGLALAALLPASSALAAHTAVRRGPAGLRFYTPPRHSTAGRHGSVIWARRLTGSAALTGAATNELVLYRSVGDHGQPVAVSGTVSLPPGRAPKGGWPVITYDHGTTGIADVCAPSMDSPTSPVHGAIDYAYPLLNSWLKAGWAVVRTDYQGLGTPGVHPYLIGVSEAHSTLDMVSAARAVEPSIGSRVIISGHSQGGQAALWAAALAAKWTPQLHVRGTVAFAPVSHLAEQTKAIGSVNTTSLSGLAAMILRGIDVGDPALHLSALLSPQAAALYPQTLTRCLPQLDQPDSFGSLPTSQLPRSGANLAPVEAALTRLADPDSLHIRTPVLIEQGTADTTVFPAFTQSLETELTALKDPVTLRTYAGVTHGGVVVAAAADSASWIRARLAG